MEFGEDNLRQLETLNPTAGPPDKLFRYLLMLGELAQALEQPNSLGRTVPKWLEERNVDASGESETIRNNRDAVRQRTFRIGGSDVHCEFHAKPSDGVHPDLCVGIYFSISSQKPKK